MTKDTRNTIWLLNMFNFARMDAEQLGCTILVLPFLLVFGGVIFLVGWLLIKAVEIGDRTIRARRLSLRDAGVLLVIAAVFAIIISPFILCRP